MKHALLCTIGHNLADSIGSGISFVTGFYEIEIFHEARSSAGGVIAIDFLTGRITEGDASPVVIRAAAAAAEALPDFCRKHGASRDDFVELSARFFNSATAHRTDVAVTDRNGVSSVTEYSGIPLARLRVLDPLGRIRPAPPHRRPPHAPVPAAASDSQPD